MNINPKEINGNWDAGWVLDVHTLSSVPLPDGEFRTERSQLGELLYQVKYRHDRTKIPAIAEIVSEFVKGQIAVDEHRDHPFPEAIIPIPPSTFRDFQPVIAIAAKIGEMLDLPAALNYLIKVKRTPPLKSLAHNESRQEQLKGAFDLQSHNGNFRYVLLFDDIYRSGETLTEATHLLRNKGGVSHVHVLTLTQTRTKQ